MVFHAPFNKLPVLLLLLLIAPVCLLSQVPFKSLVRVDTNLRDTTIYAKTWRYNWNISKDETGKFHNSIRRRIRKRDTIHNPITAHCVTNYRERQDIEFCSAYLENGALSFSLRYADGDPGFLISVKNDSITIAKHVSPHCGTHDPYTKSRNCREELVLNKSHYVKGDTLEGYINYKSLQITFSANDLNVPYVYYLKGYFKTVVN